MIATGEFWVRWRVRIGYPVALTAWALARPTPRSILWGTVIASLGLLLRAWSAGHLRKHEQLATSGPYAFTRNPLYLGSMFLAAGFLWAGRSWLAAGIVALYLAAFYPAVMKREESELRTRYGATFQDYSARVPLFIPRLTPQALRHAPFSWSLYWRNREYQAAIGALAGTALLWLRMFWP